PTRRIAACGDRAERALRYIEYRGAREVPGQHPAYRRAVLVEAAGVIDPDAQRDQSPIHVGAGRLDGARRPAERLTAFGERTRRGRGAAPGDPDESVGRRKLHLGRCRRVRRFAATIVVIQLPPAVDLSGLGDRTAMAYPSATSTNLTPSTPASGVGSRTRRVRVPSPTCPLLPRPQQYT